MADTTQDPDHGQAVLDGTCACSAIRFSSVCLPMGSSVCHCSACRKISGAPFVVFGLFPNDSVTWSTNTVDASSGNEHNVKDDGGALTAEILLTRSSKVGQRGTCKKCGSPLWMKYHCRPDGLSIPLGLIDRANDVGESMNPTEHIFLNSKVSWLPLPDDGLERHAEFDEPFRRRLEQWEQAGCPKRKDVKEDDDANRDGGTT